MKSLYEELGIEEPIAAEPIAAEPAGKGLYEELGIAPPEPQQAEAPPVAPVPQLGDDLYQSLNLSPPPDVHGARFDDARAIQEAPPARSPLGDQVVENLFNLALPFGAAASVAQGGIGGLGGGLLKGAQETKERQGFLPPREMELAPAKPGQTLGEQIAESKITPIEPDVQSGLMYRGGERLQDMAEAADPFIAMTGVSRKAQEFLQGVGTSGGIMALGYVNPVLGAVSGYNTTRDEFYQDAIRSGADENAALLASDIGAALGTSEFLPFQIPFLRLAKTPAGKKMVEALRKNLKPGWAEAVATGGKWTLTGGAETIQEMALQIGKNFTASDWVGYDPDRPWNETLIEAGAGGFGTGVILNAISSALGLRRGGGIEDEDSDGFKPIEEPPPKEFSKTRVVDVEGKPKRVFHASDPNYLFSREFYFASDNTDVAKEYGDVLSEVYLNIENPLEIDAKNARYDSIDYGGKLISTDQLAHEAKMLGHDGVIIHNLRDAPNPESNPTVSDIFIAFGQNAIKPVRKAGVFSVGDVLQNLTSLASVMADTLPKAEDQPRLTYKELERRFSRVMSKADSEKVVGDIRSALVGSEKFGKVETDAVRQVLPEIIFPTRVTEMPATPAPASSDPSSIPQPAADSGPRLNVLHAPFKTGISNPFGVDDYVGSFTGSVNPYGVFEVSSIKSSLPGPIELGQAPILLAGNLLREKVARGILLQAYRKGAKAVRIPSEQWDIINTLKEHGLKPTTVIGSTAREFALDEKALEDVEKLWGFPGPIGQVISDAFAKGYNYLLGPSGMRGQLGLGKEIDAIYKSHFDTYNNYVRMTYGLTHLVHDNPHIAGLLRYVEHTRQFWNTKTEWLARGSNRLEEIQKLSQDQQTRLGNFALDVTVAEIEKGRALTDAELIAINRKANTQIDEKSMEVWKNINEDFSMALEELYRTMVDGRRRAFTNRDGVLNEVGFEASVRKLDEEFNKIRGRHFFPLTRFGDYYVTVKTTRTTQIGGRTYKVGEVIDFQTFDGPLAELRQKRFAAKMKARPGVAVSGGKFTDEGAFRNVLSPGLAKAVKERIDLTDEQRTQFAELLIQLSPTTGFLRHMIERKGTPGFSLDFMRGYAQYFGQFANYIAREKHKGSFNDAMEEVRQSAQAIRDAGFIANKRDDIYSHLVRHNEYLYNPGNEAAGYRAAAFVFYLGFVAKSAYVNLTQPFMVAYPYLAATYGKPVEGDIKAVYGLSRAYGNLAGDWISGMMAKASKDASQALVKPGLIEPELAEAISRGVKENFLEESFATEVAGVAEGNLITRIAPGKVGRIARRAGYYSAWMFQQAERFNRRAVFIASFRLARLKIGGETPWAELSPAQREAVYVSARTAIENTMYEYARWNRPELMRGPTKATLFIFQNFVLNSLHFATRMPGKGRYWLMMFMLAGLSGLPGAEDLLNFLKAALNSSTMRKVFGLSSTPMIDLERELREYVAEVTDPETADLFMHGLGRKYGLGGLHLLSLFDVPIPNVDISGSIGMGSIIPALPQFTADIATGRGFESAFANAFQDISGAAWAMPFTLLSAIATDSPDEFKKYERALPKFAENIAKALRAKDEGMWRTRYGRAVLEVDATDPTQFAELVAQAAGFRPSVLAQAQDLDWAQAEHLAFYKARQSMIINAITYYSVVSPDREQLAVAEEQRDKFNSNAPPALRITGRMIAMNRRAKRKADRSSLEGRPRERKFRREFESLERIYPGGRGD